MQNSPSNRLACLLILSVLTSIPPSLAAADGAGHSAVTPVPREGRPHDRYLALNQRVQDNQGKVDLVFIGDSITQGWEGAGKEAWEKHYAKRKALNLGIGGDRTQHVLWRLDNGNLDGIRPKVAVVMIGTNNSNGTDNTESEIVDGVTAIVEKIQTKVPGIKILLLGIFPRGEHFNPQRGKILQVNQTIGKLAEDEDVVFLDIGSAFIEPDGSISKDIMPDFLHLSPKGYGIWAQSIEPALSSLVGGAAITASAAASDPSGEWTWTIMGPDGEVSAPLVIQVQDGKVTGRFARDESRWLTIEEGRANGNVLTFKVKRDRPDGSILVYDMTATVNGDSIQGSVTTEMDGQSVTTDWRAKKN